jgi:hypothetical protein
MEMYKKEQTNQDLNQEKAVDKREKQKKYDDNKSKLAEIQNKKPMELYCEYNFDQEVRYFSDFMQS